MQTHTGAQVHTKYMSNMQAVRLGHFRFRFRINFRVSINISKQHNTHLLGQSHLLLL